MKVPKIQNESAENSKKTYLCVMYIERTISRTFKELLQQYPIVAITGPRQSGKTTFLKKELSDYQYLSLEDPDLRSFATDDPKLFLEKYNNKIIFDEIQRVPKLFSWLQTKVDASGAMGQYVLSGSQNFHLMEQVTQSLAGRVGLLRLLPFDFKELSKAGLMPDNWLELAVSGQYPAIYTRKIQSPRFYANYIQTYLERDMSALLKVHDLMKFKSFLAICANRTGQLINLSAMANVCGISQPTAKSWLANLESSFIVFLLQPFQESQDKQVVKTPKLYFYETGLAAFLQDIRSIDDVSYTIQGPLFENLMISEMIKQNHHNYMLKNYWFWRDKEQLEVDLLSKTGSDFTIYEMKSTKSLQADHVKSLISIGKMLHCKPENKLLVYAGEESMKRTEYSIVAWKDVVNL